MNAILLALVFTGSPSDEDSISSQAAELHAKYIRDERKRVRDAERRERLSRSIALRNYNRARSRQSYARAIGAQYAAKDAMYRIASQGLAYGRNRYHSPMCLPRRY